MAQQSTDLSADKTYQYSEFKDVFVDSAKSYFSEVAVKDKDKFDVFEARKNHFKSLINGKTRVKNLDEEYIFEKGILISSTDLNGTITYANSKFCEACGYSLVEVVGKNHNILRHPSMPSELFADMWSTLKNNKGWMGIVKNLRKDGRYYWAHIHITPILNDNKITGYSSVSKPAMRSELPSC